MHDKAGRQAGRSKGDRKRQGPECVLQRSSSGITEQQIRTGTGMSDLGCCNRCGKYTVGSGRLAQGSGSDVVLVCDDCSALAAGRACPVDGFNNNCVGLAQGVSPAHGERLPLIQIYRGQNKPLNSHKAGMSGPGPGLSL